MPFWINALVFAEGGTLVLLVGLSVYSVSIMIDRRRVFKREDESLSFDVIKKSIQERDIKSLKELLSSGTGLRAEVMRAALDVEGRNFEQVDRAVLSVLSERRSALERGFSVLATLGSNAPFIGLFGTVLGIISAFASLASQGSDTAAVMSGVSRALVATAAGLFVAIPAVVAYNVYSRRLKGLMQECQVLRDLYLSKLDLAQTRSADGRHPNAH